MNKKGFTLIEIIVCISMLVVIGVGSFIGIRMVNKKLTIKELKQITDKAVQAAQIYIETNKEVTNQLYSNQNGVSLPLQLLVNEGLLNLDGTKLNENDIKDQYVVTFLGGTGSSEDCEQITSTTSWSNNQPIYLCMKSDGSSNLATIDPTIYSNKTKVSNEPYYFKGLDPNNWIVIKNFVCWRREEGRVSSRIVYIDRDDTIVFVTTDEGCHISGKEPPGARDGIDFYSTWDGKIKHEKSIEYNSSAETKTCWWSWLYSSCLSNRSGERFDDDIESYNDGNRDNKYYRLPKECKISSGTGARDNKFIVKCN